MADDDRLRGPDEGPRRAGTGRPDYHDPTAGIGGAPPSRSALTLRLLLAGFGFVLFLVAAIWLAAVDGPVALVVVFAVLALIAAVDIVVVIRRKARGEPS